MHKQRAGLRDWCVESENTSNPHHNLIPRESSDILLVVLAEQLPRRIPDREELCGEVCARFSVPVSSLFWFGSFGKLSFGRLW